MLPFATEYRNNDNSNGSFDERNKHYLESRFIAMLKVKSNITARKEVPAKRKRAINKKR